MTRVVTLALLLALVPGVSAGQKYAATGMVLDVDPARRTFVASIETIPGFMAAMTMPFEVRDAKELADLGPGTIVEFTVVVEGNASWAEGIRIRPYAGLEPDPLAARRLALLRGIARGRPAARLGTGDAVPDFTLTDQHHRRIALSQLRGKVVGINFVYTTCQLPEFCLRVVNHFAVLQKRFRKQLGRELVLLTITFDPARDQPDELRRYATQWKPDRDGWRFLTGPVSDVQQVVGMFGVVAFPNDGLMDHSLRTVLIDRDGRLAASIEGNQYSSDQLADLTETMLNRRPSADPRK